MSVPPGVLQGIFDRLTALEAQGSPVNEASTPNYLTQDAQGRVGANFSGLINALGLILPAAAVPSLPTPALNSIQWQRQSDGAVVAQVGAGEGAGIDIVALEALGQGTNEAFAGVVARAASGVSAELDVQAFPASSQVVAQLSDGSQVDVLSTGQQSSFVQVAPTNATNPVFLDGPHVLLSPGMAAGGQAFGAGFTTNRLSWTFAIALGMTEYNLGAGVPVFAGAQYTGGASFRDVWICSGSAASPANQTCEVIVIGI